MVESNQILMNECLKRSCKSVEKFTLLDTKELKMKRVKRAIGNEDNEKEGFIIDCLQKDPYLEEVFMTKTIQKDKAGYLYPTSKDGADVCKLIKTGMLAPKYYEQLVRVIDHLIDCGLKIDGDNLLTYLVIIENEIKCNYITPLQEKLHILLPYETEEYSERIFDYISKCILINISPD